MKTRTYGDSGPFVILLHGGPGATGYMAPVARGLADGYRVLEPFQRRSGGERLTVARHVADLHELIETRCPGERPALVGSSWGAMLALVYGAEHPGRAGPFVLIGTGTFDEKTRLRMYELLDERMTDAMRERMQQLPSEIPDPDERLGAMGDLLLPLYTHDLLTTDLEFEGFDARSNRETWADMLRLMEDGVYPARCSVIDAPVLMLHGDLDPHPGAEIRDSLLPHMPQVEYREWERCGHYPWAERAVRDEFFAVLREWLARHHGASA